MAERSRTGLARDEETLAYAALAVLAAAIGVVVYAMVA